MRVGVLIVFLSLLSACDSDSPDNIKNEMDRTAKCMEACKSVNREMDKHNSYTFLGGNCLCKGAK